MPCCAQVRANAAALGVALSKRGYKLVTGGTDNHLVLWDLRPEVRRSCPLYDHHHNIWTCITRSLYGCGVERLSWTSLEPHACFLSVSLPGILCSGGNGSLRFCKICSVRLLVLQSLHAERMGTSVHMQGVNGNKMEKACDLVHITLNKNAVVGDVSALAPGGVRIGAPAMTSRGLKESDFEAIADLLHEVRGLCTVPRVQDLLQRVGR